MYLKYKAPFTSHSSSMLYLCLVSFISATVQSRIEGKKTCFMVDALKRLCESLIWAWCVEVLQVTVRVSSLSRKAQVKNLKKCVYIYIWCEEKSTANSQNICLISWQIYHIIHIFLITNLQSIRMCIVPVNKYMICPSLNRSPSGKHPLNLTIRLVVLRHLPIILPFFCCEMSSMLKHLPFIHHTCLN